MYKKSIKELHLHRFTSRILHSKSEGNYNKNKNWIYAIFYISLMRVKC